MASPLQTAGGPSSPPFPNPEEGELLLAGEAFVKKGFAQTRTLITEGEKRKLSLESMKKVVPSYIPTEESLQMESWIENFYVQLVTQFYSSGNKRTILRFKRRYKARETEETRFYTFDIPIWHFEQLFEGINLMRQEGFYKSAVLTGNRWHNITDEETQQEKRRKLEERLAGKPFYSPKA